MSSFLTKLEESVSTAHSVEDLISILRHIPLQSLKNVINESLKSMNEDKVRSIYYETCSIEDVMPCDVIQSMLGYISPQSSTKCISKTFKNASEKNEILNQRSREQMIASHFKGENVWHLYQQTLQKNEEPKQYIASFDAALNAMECGDKIYIHDGEYILSYNYKFDSKNIQIEGIGKCCIAMESFDKMNDNELKNR